MVRETLSVDTSLMVLFITAKKQFLALSHSTHFEMERKKNKIIFLTESSEYCCIHFTGWPF